MSPSSSFKDNKHVKLFFFLQYFHFPHGNTRSLYFCIAHYPSWLLLLHFIFPFISSSLLTLFEYKSSLNLCYIKNTDPTHYHELHVLSKLPDVLLPRTLAHVQYRNCKTNSLSLTWTKSDERRLWSGIQNQYSPQSVSHFQGSRECSFSFSNILLLAPKFVFHSCFFLLQHNYILLKISHLSTALHRTCHFIHNIHLATSSTNSTAPSPLSLLMVVSPQIHLSSPLPSCSSYFRT